MFLLITLHIRLSSKVLPTASHSLQFIALKFNDAMTKGLAQRLGKVIENALPKPQAQPSHSKVEILCSTVGVALNKGGIFYVKKAKI